MGRSEALPKDEVLLEDLRGGSPPERRVVRGEVSGRLRAGDSEASPDDVWAGNNSLRAWLVDASNALQRGEKTGGEDAFGSTG